MMPEGCGTVEIPYYVMNFKKEFKEKMSWNYFVQEYLDGHTPNPCIACNRYVKWESLLQRSLEIGADYIANGTLCAREEAAEWPLCDLQVCDGGEGSDLRAL